MINFKEYLVEAAAKAKSKAKKPADKKAKAGKSKAGEIVIKKSDIKPETLTKRLSHADSHVRIKALAHPGIKSSHINLALDDAEPTVRAVALHRALHGFDSEGKNKEGFLKKAMVDVDQHVRGIALNHKECTPQLISVIMTKHLKKQEKENEKAQQKVVDDKAKMLDDRVKQMGKGGMKGRKK